MPNPDRSFWAAQRVLLVGHTGFKGAWLTLWLEHLGASVFGLALPPDTEPSLFGLLQPFARLESRLGDIRNYETVAAAVRDAAPTIAIHMAAQPLVRRSYREPVETFATNVMGTVHVLEALRGCPETHAILVVTTDKVYDNNNEARAFVEGDRLGGSDPYSASKAAAELAAQCWGRSFFADTQAKVAAVRAGNVIGGGDWSEDRLVPDVWRAARENRPVRLRYPSAVRPWQHVLDVTLGYLLYAERLARPGAQLPPALNIGPLPGNELTVSEVVEILQPAFGSASRWESEGPPGLVEKSYLALDPTLAMQTLGWNPRFTARSALGWTAEWYRKIDSGMNPRTYSLEQIERYVRMDQNA